MQLQPYLFFGGNCAAALDLYASVFGGASNVEMMRFKDGPPGAVGSGGDPDGVMHATFTAPGIAFMASDGRPGEKYAGGNISMSIATTDVAAGERMFAALAEGGTIETPLEKMFWGATFGQLTDRYGIDWMFNLG